jgi:hypothetical protein
MPFLYIFQTQYSNASKIQFKKEWTLNLAIILDRLVLLNKLVASLDE